MTLKRGMLERAERLAVVREHAVSASHQAQVLSGGQLSKEQRDAFEHKAHTLASLEWTWDKGKELISKRDVLVIDEAGAPFRGSASASS